MEKQFPKNVRQIGNVCDTPKIYVEDYVDTYLNQLRGRTEERTAAAFLIGEFLNIEEQECVAVTGALRIKDPVSETGKITMDKEAYKAGEAECREYFPESKIVGWFLIDSGIPMGLNSDIVDIHENFFQKKNSIFIMKDAVEGEELYFAYKYRELMQIGGHYIFYEKNPFMQSYMINSRRQNGALPSEVVEDRAARNFRNTVKERMEIREQRSNSRFVYLTSSLLLLMVLAIGISAMNNYDKMNAVQDSIETLAKTVQEPKEKEREEEVKEKEDTQDMQKTQEQPEDAEPAASTIQEELEEKNYYIVQKGDTLDSISRKHYGTLDETEAICKMNGLTDGNLIFIGQKLLLP